MSTGVAGVCIAVTPPPLRDQLEDLARTREKACGDACKSGWLEAE